MSITDDKSGRFTATAPPPAPSRLSGTAVVSLILGVAALVPYTFGVAALPALWFGYRGLYAVNASQGRLRGRRVAQAGMVLGAVGAVIVVVWGLVIVGAKLNADSARASCVNNLRQLGQGLTAYSNAHGVLGLTEVYPPGTVPNAGLPPAQRLSWYAEVLPYLEVRDGVGPWQNLAGSLDPALAWDAGPNAAAARTTIPRLVCPARTHHEPGQTNYVGLAGVGLDAATLPASSPDRGFFGYDRLLSTADLTAKGSRFVMCVIETADRNGPWLAGGFPTVRGVAADAERYIGPGSAFGGLHRGGANALRADGSVQFESENVKPEIFRGLARVAP